jgi:hypothetical protein
MAVAQSVSGPVPSAPDPSGTLLGIADGSNGLLAQNLPGTTGTTSRPVLPTLPTPTSNILPTDVLPLNAAQERIPFGENLQLRINQFLPSRFFFSASTEASFRPETNIFQFPKKRVFLQKLPPPQQILRLNPFQQEQVLQEVKLADSFDHVFRVLPNVTAGWTLSQRTRLYGNYFMLRDQYAKHPRLNQVIHSYSYGLQQDVPFGQRGNLTIDLQARELNQMHQHSVFDFIPALTFSYIVTPRMVVFLNSLLQIRGRKYFQAPTRELDPFYTLGLLYSRGGWTFSASTTFVQNFREPYHHGAQIPVDNYVSISDFEIARRLFRQLPGVQAFVRAEPIFNMHSHNTPGLAGVDFRLFYGLRMALAKPALTAIINNIIEQLKQQEENEPGNQTGPKPSAHLPNAVLAGLQTPIHGEMGEPDPEAGAGTSSTPVALMPERAADSLNVAVETAQPERGAAGSTTDNGPEALIADVSRADWSPLVITANGVNDKLPSAQPKLVLHGAMDDAAAESTIAAYESTSKRTELLAHAAQRPIEIASVNADWNGLYAAANAAPLNTRIDYLPALVANAAASTTTMAAADTIARVALLQHTLPPATPKPIGGQRVAIANPAPAPARIISALPVPAVPSRMAPVPAVASATPAVAVPPRLTPSIGRVSNQVATALQSLAPSNKPMTTLAQLLAAPITSRASSIAGASVPLPTPIRVASTSEQPEPATIVAQPVAPKETFTTPPLPVAPAGAGEDAPSEAVHIAVAKPAIGVQPVPVRTTTTVEPAPAFAVLPASRPAPQPLLDLSEHATDLAKLANSALSSSSLGSNASPYDGLYQQRLYLFSLMDAASASSSTTFYKATCYRTDALVARVTRHDTKEDAPRIVPTLVAQADDLKQLQAVVDTTQAPIFRTTVWLHPTLNAAAARSSIVDKQVTEMRIAALFKPARLEQPPPAVATQPMAPAGATQPMAPAVAATKQAAPPPVLSSKPISPAVEAVRPAPVSVPSIDIASANVDWQGFADLSLRRIAVSIGYIGDLHRVIDIAASRTAKPPVYIASRLPAPKQPASTVHSMPSPAQPSRTPAAVSAPPVLFMSVSPATKPARPSSSEHEQQDLPSLATPRETLAPGVAAERNAVTDGSTLPLVIDRHDNTAETAAQLSARDARRNHQREISASSPVSKMDMHIVPPLPKVTIKDKTNPFKDSGLDLKKPLMLSLPR